MIYILVLLVVVLLGEVFLVRKGMKAARNAAFPRGGAGQPPAVKAARPNKRTQRESAEEEPSSEPSPVSEPPALLPAEKYPNVVEFPDRSRTKEPTDLRREIRGKTSSQLVQEKSMLEIIQDIRGKNDQNESPGVPSALSRNLGTTNSEIPLTPSGASGVRASTRWTMLSVMSCSP